jgi:hypothetical protein
MGLHCLPSDLDQSCNKKQHLSSEVEDIMKPVVIPMNAETVIRLREALQESQTRLAQAEARVADLQESLQMAAQEIAPLRRLAEVVIRMDVISRASPLENEALESEYLRCLEGKDQALRFYRQSIDPSHSSHVQRHIRRVSLALAAQILKASGEAEMLPAVLFLGQEAELLSDPVELKPRTKSDEYIVEHNSAVA